MANALIKKLVYDENMCACDHLGNKFKSVESMCRLWRINSNTFRTRLTTGLTVKDALEKDGTTPIGEPGQAGDAICCYGEYFPRLKCIIDRYNIGYIAIQKHTDDLEMFISYINQATIADKAVQTEKNAVTVRARLNNGWEEDDALNAPIRHKASK